jgi:hypothetical protein
MADNMFDFFIFRDERVQGNFANSAVSQILMELNGSSPLANAFTRLNTAAKTQGAGGKLNTLFIIGHGLGSGDLTTKSDFWWQGGQGVQIGQENLTAANVSNWAAIRNTVDIIVVYACGAAYSGHTILNPQNTNDGQALMSALAKHTNAIVYAADRIQWFFPSDFNFGRWEGTVYMFQPNGVVVRGFRPPTEIIDVTAPIPDGVYGPASELLKSRRNA